MAKTLLFSSSQGFQCKRTSNVNESRMPLQHPKLQVRSSQRRNLLRWCLILRHGDRLKALKLRVVHQEEELAKMHKRSKIRIWSRLKALGNSFKLNLVIQCWSKHHSGSPLQQAGPHRERNKPLTSTSWSTRSKTYLSNHLWCKSRV